MTKSVYSVDGSASTTITAVGDPKIIHPIAIEFRKGNEVLGTIKATYDFSGLPPKYHEFAFRMIIKTQVGYWGL